MRCLMIRYLLLSASGRGKSTLVKLLLKYYNDYSGNIMLSGQDIRRLSEKEIYTKIGVVDQASYLFNAFLYENITLFRGRRLRILWTLLQEIS